MRTGTISASPTRSAGSFEPFDAGPFAWARDPLPFAPACDARAGRRAVITALLAWAPLAVLAAVDGFALGPNPHESVLLDFAAYGRYLVASPVLVYAGSAVLPRLARVVRQFVDGGLLRDADLGRYEALVESTRRLLVSRWVDIIIVILACIATAVRSQVLYPRNVSTWVRPMSEGIAHVSLAGWWRTLVSQPLFNALLGIWLWRLLLWVRFMYRMTQMDLQLVAAHPDQLGGLRFTLGPLRGFAFLAFAIGAVGAGSVAESVLIDGTPLSAFRVWIGAQILVVLALFAGPSLLWMDTLIRLQGSGTLQYGSLATRLGQAFQRRWLAPGRDIGTQALEAEDFSATIDLYSIVANVRGINPYMLDVGALTMLTGSTLLPYVPLLLAVMPLEQVLRFALKTFA
jgi:hypothetical protein